MKKTNGLKSILSLILCFAMTFGMMGTLVSCKGEKEPAEAKKAAVYADALEEYRKSDWSAEWIWNEESKKNTFMAFRKTFSADGVGESVKASVSACDKYLMWINGEPVVYDGPSKRGPTPYDTYFEEVEISPYLKEGENTLAVLVIYYGQSGYSMTSAGRGGFLFEAQIGSALVKTDASFKVKRLEAYRNNGTADDYKSYAQYGALAETHVYYDAREEIGEWMKADYDDSAWHSATAVAKAGEVPFGFLYKTVTPSIAFSREITDYLNSDEYVGRQFSEDSTIELLLPVNRQFSPYFECTAASGKKITFYTDTFQSGQNNAMSFRDDYITKDGAQAYENYPWRSGSKLIVEVPAGVTFTRLGYRESGYASRAMTGFETDDAEINGLWTKALNTISVTMRDTYMDCPDRERAPYIGDTVNEMGMAYYALDTQSYALGKKAILTTLGWVDESSVLSSCVPGSSGYELIVQNLAFLSVMDDYILYTGDVDTVKKFYPAMIAYLKLWSFDGDGLPVIRKGALNGWVDWGENPDKEGLQIAWYYDAVVSLKQTASLLNVHSDDDFLREKEESVRNGFAKFKTSEGYKTQSVEKADERLNALAVVSGLAEESEYEKIYALLTDESAYQSSPYMEKYCEEALCILGKYEEAKERIKTRYREMLMSEYTTLWEYFDRTGTINHAWSGGYMNVIGKYFFGIQPTSTGYATYEIKPQTVFGTMRLTIDTVRGTIAVSAEKQGNGYVFAIDAPSGGTLLLPAGLTLSSVEGNASIADNGVTLNGGSCVIRATSI